MRKGLHIFFSLLSTIVLMGIVIPVISSILLSSYTIQNYVAREFMEYASHKLGTTVTLERIQIKFFNRVAVKGFYVEDMQGDTLLYAANLDVGLRGYNPFTGVFRLGDVRMDSAAFYVVQDSTETTNLKRITRQLRRETPKENRNDFILRANRLLVTDSHFRLRKYVVPERPYGMNYADLDVEHIHLDIQQISLVNDSIQASIHALSATEKCGFNLHDFAAEEVRVSSTGLELKQLSIMDDYSDVSMDLLRFTYPNWHAYNQFTEQVVMHAEMERCRVAFRTIGFFAPTLRHWESEVLASGVVDGTVGNLNGRFDPAKIRDTQINMSYRIAGLPDITKTVFTFDIQELTTHAEDAVFIVGDVSGKDLGRVKSYLEKLGDIRLAGYFNGLLTDFLANGDLTSTPGDLHFDVRMNPTESGRTHLNGEVSLEHFALGELLAVNLLGEVSLSAQLNGFMGSDSLRMDTNAMIEQLYYNGYTYHNIDLDGEIRNNYYEGRVASADPNILFDLNGMFDFNGTVPRYDFALNLQRADLRKLNLNRRDSVSILSCQMEMNAVGTNLDDINGAGSLRDLTYCFPGDTLLSREIRFLANNNSASKQIGFYSDFVDVELNSRLNIMDIIPYARQTLRYYLPSLDTLELATHPELYTRLDSTRLNSADNYYVVKATVKQNGQFASAILPGLYVGEGTTFSFLLNPATRNFNLNLNSEEIEYKEIYIANLNLTNRNEADSIALYLRTDEVGIGNFYMPRFSVNGGIKDNLVNLALAFNNDLNQTSAIVNTVSWLEVNPEAHTSAWHTRFSSSQINVGEQQWWITSPSIVWNRDAIDVERFRIATQGQQFLVYGRVSESLADTLHLSMINFDLSPLTGLIDRYGYTVQGRTNGHADLIAGKGARLFYGHIGLEEIRVNDHPIQNSTFVSEWDNAEDRIRMSLILASQDTVMRGGYRPGDQRYYANFHFPNIDLVHLSPVLGGVLSDIKGEADARLVLAGVGGEPVLNGTITVPRFAGTVDFTKVRYGFTDGVIQVVNNNLTLPKTTVYDDAGGQAELELALNTRYLSNLSYEVRVNTDKILALNTTERDNDLFYGRAFASGSVGIRGDRHKVNMDMILNTEANSSFFMPLMNSASIVEADFITFEDSTKTVDSMNIPRYRLAQMLRERRRRGIGQSDLEINMLINAMPNTEIQLVIDPKIGDIIKANGRGALNLHIRPREDLFTMFGDYQINEGSYLFTMMNVINKRFIIERGSSIQWTGEPINPLLNITATYRVRATVPASMTIAASQESRSQNIPVDCNIILTDRLSQPTINFDITLPSGNSEMRNAIQNAMNTQELKSQQFVWLLMSNSFYVDAGDDRSSNIGTTATAVTGMEFLTNQFSNWLSTERFSFNLGYTPKSDITSDEVEGAFMGEIIPNKLFFEGEINYNFGNGKEMTNRNANQVTGDFALSYVFDQTGNLRGKVFTRTIDRYDENQGLQESGVGLYYRKDFNTVRDLFTRRNRKPILVPQPAGSGAPEGEEKADEDPADFPSADPMEDETKEAMP